VSEANGYHAAMTRSHDLSLSLGLCLLAFGCGDSSGVVADATDTGTDTETDTSGVGDGDGDPGDGDGDGDPGDGDGDGEPGDGDGDGDGDPGDGDGDGDGDDDPPMLPLCGTTPPDGAELAPALPTYPGICPTLQTGMEHVMTTGGGERSFIFVAPTEVQPDEQLPVMVMYHWLGGDAGGFYDRAEVQAAADYYRFIALIPNGRDIDQFIVFKWPFAIIDSDAAMQEDFDMFDDMIACAAEQYNVDKECVSGIGVSAGALFLAQLASRHGDRLSSFLSLSGGVGGLVKNWEPGGNIMPAMVLWGGRQDFCIAIDFSIGSKDLEAELEQHGHPIVECIHNCTHATPPLEPPPDVPTYAMAWEFMLAHPYWLEDGYSPFSEFDAMPSPFPEWCAYGANNAVERVGMCGGSECQ
jgi:predicted esterase